MAYKPVVFEDFNGLRLLPEQGEAPGAVSMLNVDLSRDKTQIGSRGGLSRLGTGTASYHRIVPFSSTQLVVIRNNGSGLVLQTVNLSDGSFGTATTAYGGASTIATSAVTVASSSLAVCSRSGSTNEDLRTWLGDGNPATSASWAPRYLTISPIDTSIMAAHFSSGGGAPSGSGATGSTSMVVFGIAESLSLDEAAGFASGDWIELDANDGEEITGLATWRDIDVVVKRKAMFVHYGNSTDASGNRVFNFRRVELPARARATTNRDGANIVAGGDALYLLLNDGVYRTTGDVPQLISRDISPLFDGTGDSASVFPSSGDWTFGYASNRLYLSYQNGSNYRTLVYDTLLREWFLWDIAVGASAIPTNVLEWYDTNGLPTGYVASGAKVFSFTKTGTSDDGTSITSSYQSGFVDFGPVGATAYTRWTRLWGTGTPTVSVFTDYGSTDSNSGSVTLGTAPAVAEGYHNKSYTGKRFSHKINATSAWTVNRIQHDVSSVRP